MNIQASTIIRERGQITIPQKIRSLIPWVAPLSIIHIQISDNETITITPHMQKSIDWKDIWNQIDLVQSFHTGKGNLSQFIIDDRERH